MEKAYKNVGYFLLLLIPLSFVGFYKSYLIQFPDFKENFGIYIHLHAVIALVWVLFLIVQPFLIRYNKNELHRIVGKMSYGVFGLLILSFIPQIIRLFHSNDPRNVFFPLSDSILLLLFYGLAMYHKCDVSKHMRYMIGSSLVLLGPTIGRIGPYIFNLNAVITQNIQYGITYLILARLIFYDRNKHKPYYPYVVVFVAYVFHQITFHLIFWNT
ncbi:MAG: hypothetical protein WAT79_00160 [Saprospiraceae bacterium]